MASTTSSKDSQNSHSDKPCIPVEKRFPALGSETMISIITDDVASAQKTITHIERVIVDFEHRFSRFLVDSELSRLNRADGAFRASDAMIHILTAAKKWHEKTEGVFDPTIIAALETFGYDKSLPFARGPIVEKETLNITEHTERFFARAFFSSLVIDEKTRTVHIPHGLRIDLGGIGKGYIADICADAIAATHPNFWFSAGGDICLSGSNCKEPWRVGVQDPKNQEHDIGYITIKEGTRAALATSGIIKRKGVKGHFEWHHLVDPTTGLPARNDILSVTVLAPTATAADVLAKTVLILGKEKGLAHIRCYPDTGCLIIDTNGTIRMSDFMRHHFTKRS